MRFDGLIKEITEILDTEGRYLSLPIMSDLCSAIAALRRAGRELADEHERVDRMNPDEVTA